MPQHEWIEPLTPTSSLVFQDASTNRATLAAYDKRTEAAVLGSQDTPDTTKPPPPDSEGQAGAV